LGDIILEVEMRIITYNNPEKSSENGIFSSVRGKLLWILNELPGKNE